MTLPGYGDEATWGPVTDPRDPRWEEPERPSAGEIVRDAAIGMEDAITIMYNAVVWALDSDTAFIEALAAVVSNDGVGDMDAALEVVRDTLKQGVEEVLP